jgi:hypothetical protein
MGRPDTASTLLTLHPTGLTSDNTGTRQLGIQPSIALFLLVPMVFTRTKPEGERAEWASSEQSSPQA